MLSDVVKKTFYRLGYRVVSNLTLLNFNIVENSNVRIHSSRTYLRHGHRFLLIVDNYDFVNYSCVVRLVESVRNRALDYRLYFRFI